MLEFVVAALVSLGLILFCTAMFYEILAHVWLILPRLEKLHACKFYSPYFQHSPATPLRSGRSDSPPMS